MAEKVVVTYDLKKSCGDSVRLKPVSVNSDILSEPTPRIDSPGLGDIYVSRSIMNALGLKDSDPVKVTFEKA